MTIKNFRFPSSIGPPVAKSKPFKTYFLMITFAALFLVIKSNVIFTILVTVLFGFLIGRLNIKAALLSLVAISPIMHPAISIEVPGQPLINYQRLLLIGLIVAFIYRRKRLEINRVKGNKLLLLFIISSVITALLSQSPVNNLFATATWVFEVFVVLLLLTNGNYESHDLIVFSEYLSISLLIAIAFGIIELLLNRRIFQELVPLDSIKINIYDYAEATNRMAISRIHSVFEHPFAFGNFAAILMPLWISLFMAQKKIFAMVIFLLSFGPVIVSSSRATLVLAVLGAIIVMCLSFGYIKRVVVLAFIIGVLLIVLIQVSDIGNYVSEFFSPEKIKYSQGLGSSVEDRIDMAKEALAMLKEHYFFGLGKKTVQKEVLIGNIRGVGNLESYFIALFMFSGIMGAMLFAAYLYIVARALIHKLKKTQMRCYMATASLAILVAVSIHFVHSGWVNETLFAVAINLPFIFSERTNVSVGPIRAAAGDSRKLG